MTIKQITNPGQAFSLGATWGTPSVDNAMTVSTCDLINGTGVTLYTGDIVALDVTGTQAIFTTTGNLTNLIGTVGDSSSFSTYPTTGTFPVRDSGINIAAAGGNTQPFQDTEWQTLSVGFTNGNNSLTSSSSAAVNPLAVGLIVITPYNASTNATPQIFQIVSNGGSAGSWTATDIVIAGSGTTFSGTTGSFNCQVGNNASSLGPGWSAPPGWTSSSTFPPGQVVPVVTQGLGRINVNGVSAVAASDGLGGTNASAVATRFAYASTGYANAAGLIIGVALEAYAARDTTLTTAGITGHDSIRAIIGKM